ncbi:hypothetical protein DAPPUDRAFT_330918 [Daphnia pulex]|uniref:Uncharacterized protein n=1 Tax=Daphnia pulex TaxID=6669 RepID=E9HL03_DAPPU|nr:hypothetical protein DAPPUDRAFT_330918 [Daphnia pulex]|eukprot:EFX67563.1 hypothetical protein DAPPUDRAFT_330918 [Daphnia pulex]
MSKLRLSAESSLFYLKNKSKKDLNPLVLPVTHDSSASDQESDVSGDGEPEDDFNGFSPQVSHTNTQSKIQSMSISGQENAAKLNNPEDRELQLKGSFTRKPSTRPPAAEKKKEVGTKFDSADFFQEPASLSEKGDKKTKPPAKKRGKKNAENPSTEIGNAPEPAAKRPRVASKRTATSTEEPTTASTEHADNDNNPKKNLRWKKVSKIVDEVELDLSAGGSKSKPPKSAELLDPTLHENKGRGRGRGRGRPERDVSAEFGPGTSSSSPSKSLDDQSRMEAKTPEAINDEAHEMILETAEKPKERIHNFLSSSESEVEDTEDDEDDFIFPSRNSFRKTKSPKNAVPLPSFKTPTTVTNKVSKLVSPKISKFRLLPEPAPLLRTPRRTTLVRELSLNRVEPSISDPEDVADTELYKRSQQKTQLPSTSRANEKSSEETPVSKRRSLSDSSKKPSPTKRLQSPLKSSQQPNDPENDIFGTDSGLVARIIEAVQERLERTMLRFENSTNRHVPLNSAIDPSTLPVPNRSPLRTQFNLYLASPGDPVRAQELLSNNTEYSISLVDVQPTIVHALKINNPMLVVRLKGSVEFRSDPHAPSRILLNSPTRLVDLKAGRTLHVVNTGEEVASFALFEFF